MIDPTADPTQVAASPATSPDRWGTTWAHNRRRFLALAGASGIVLGTTTACGSAAGRKPGGTASGRAGESGETLFVAGFQWGPPTSFNPVSANPAWPSGGGQSQLLYESLLRFNLLDGSLQPGLGKELKADGKTLTVTLQDGTKWQDGSELTAADAVFTFELAKAASLSYSNVWEYLEKVEATDPRTVTFTLKDKPFNPGTVKATIASTLILPKAIWEKIDPAKVISEANLKPVGSGPFTLKLADQTQVRLEKFPEYWGKAIYGDAPMKFVHHQIFKGNQDGDLALESGSVDASQQFTAQIWKMWEAPKSKPVGTWLKKKPYYVPGNLPMIVFNLTKKGLNNPVVRKAIAHAIDYQSIASQAMSDYSDVVASSLVVPKGSEEKYFDATAAKAEGWSYDPDKAQKILVDELKAKKGGDGFYALPDGTKLGPWKVITPTGWTDWNTSCNILAKSCRDAGINVVTEFPQQPTWATKQQNGDFDITHTGYTGVGPASPWARFRDAMDIRGVPGIGKTAFRNYGRFNDPAVAGLLDAAGGATDEAAGVDAIKKLDAIYRKNIPCIPVMYRPLEFYEYNESNWTGFPDEEDPYAPPMWQGAGIQWLFKIKKIGS